VTLKHAIDVALCRGWIDGLRKGWDTKSYLRRYTRRRSMEGRNSSDRLGWNLHRAVAQCGVEVGGTRL